jgi:hypothetical protein
MKKKGGNCPIFFFFFFFFVVLGLKLRAYTLSHSISPFSDESCELFAWGWLRTAILLISAS